jgi:O-antigen/teichoic acid export membrane protein
MDAQTASDNALVEGQPQHSAAATTSGASVVRGGVWTAASTVLPQFFTLAVSVTAARELGPSGLGRQSFIAFVAASAISVFGLGLPVALMRTVGECVGAGRSAEARGLVVWAARLSSFGATGALLALLAAAMGGAEPSTAWVLAAITAAVGVVTAIPGAALTGLQRWRDTAVVILVWSAIGAAATILLLVAGGGVTSMIAAQLATAIGILVGVTARAVRRVRSVAPASTKPPRALKLTVLRNAVPAFAAAMLTLIVFRRSEFFFLQHWWNDRQTALYSVAFSAVATLVFLPQALAMVVSPAMATLLGARQHDRIRSGYARSLRLLLIASLPLAAGALALGPATVELVFGERFHGSRLPLLILLAPFPLVPLSTLSFSLVIGLGKIRFPLIVGLGSALLNIGLDLALIPDHAAVGAAVANACAQTATAAAAVAYGARLTAPVRWEARTLAHAAVASTVAGLAAFGAVTVLSGAAGVVAGIVAGAAAFCSCARLLRILPRDDAVWITASFGVLLGGSLARTAGWLAVSAPRKPDQ